MDKTRKNSDAMLIWALGGSSAVAKLLGDGYTKQRVHNWQKRGIPASVKLQYPKIFLQRNKE